MLLMTVGLPNSPLPALNGGLLRGSPLPFDGVEEGGSSPQI